MAFSCIHQSGTKLGTFHGCGEKPADPADRRSVFHRLFPCCRWPRARAGSGEVAREGLSPLRRIGLQPCLKCYYDQKFMSRMKQKCVLYSLSDVAVPVLVTEMKFGPRKLKILNLEKWCFRLRHCEFMFQ